MSAQCSEASGLWIYKEAVRSFLHFSMACKLLAFPPKIVLFQMTLPLQHTHSVLHSEMRERTLSLPTVDEFSFSSAGPSYTGALFDYRFRNCCIIVDLSYSN